MDSTALKALAEHEESLKTLRAFGSDIDPHTLHALASIADSDPNAIYTTTEIPKGNGKMRTIQIPHPLLMEVQQQLKLLLNQYPIYNPIYGFRPNMNAQMGLRMMLSRYQRTTNYHQINSSYQSDIQDFFPSITSVMIRKAIQDCLHIVVEGYGHDRLNLHTKTILVDGLTEVCSHESHMPQGAPTSPMLSNIVAKPMDNAMQRLFRNNERLWGSWGRYADDTAIFLAEPMYDSDLREIEAIPAQHGFKLAPEKTKISSLKKQHTVWGMDVLPPRDGYMEKTPIRFRVPREDVSALNREICHLSEICKETIDDPAIPKQLDSAIGSLSYAAYVGRYGFDLRGKQTTYLPQRLEGSWMYLLHNARTLLPESAPTWFLRERENRHTELF